MPKNGIEAQLQRSIWEHVKIRGNPRAMIFHVPNGEHRSKATGAKLKAMGVVAGVADLVCVSPDGIVQFMELKAPGGTLSDAQRVFRDRCLRMGITHTVMADIDSALITLEAWGILLPSRF